MSVGEEQGRRWKRVLYTCEVNVVVVVCAGLDELSAMYCF